ncbi:hypothetical protein F441_09481 [Phytophthora nicotianae CJ01A1]|uniref:Uncharacterized protein n=12 Tax=Phytophthora nicotianae TaxID=4792 RepID=V9F3E0_PHYNI|nr:hypothetical protein PPTG_12018 [Phytophthora nicotianae INRA-310]ETI46024.1 hypothetical protein F443_09548 [Phytophthora nicotianae P1569]ETK85990.1 hypothetical protein L915_09342 [Phytophthora nicotianae]ETO74715.1 hypothetical protein F444_09613 [Phytophthora nicotianae P1976]ETP15859.1 hypothetical protein F441_09481 [Phytophthora nicotianae CJ01A1]ETP43912.1 hypothetical protein F442_09455 [Phytophthora nicotianae P10297]KUG01895.1 hypothetical protein AM587_10010605 [Phytophthora n
MVSQSTQEAWEKWWHTTKSGSIRTYVSIVLFFLSTVLANPIARCLFWSVRKACPKKWIWPDDARLMMMWQTSLMCRVGLLWIAILVSRLSLLLYEWPAWVFGVCFIIWMDSGGNVIREVIVRKGVVGYKKDEKAGRMTLLYEGSTLAKMLLLVLIVYTYYVAPQIEDSNELRLLFSVGFFVSIALAALPLLRNVMGAHYMFLANMLHLDSRIYLHGSRKGNICDAPLGFIVLATPDNTKTFIPAGGTVSNTTEVFHRFLWPLRLDVRVPADIPAKRVREFVQDMDKLLFWDPVVVIAPDGTATLDVEGTSSFMDASTPRESVSAPGFTNTEASEMTAKLLFDENRQEEERIIQRARGNEGYVALEPNKRWVVHFRTFVQATQKTYFRQTRAAYIEAITKLMEKQGTAFGSRAVVTESQSADAD